METVFCTEFIDFLEYSIIIAFKKQLAYLMLQRRTVYQTVLDS